MNETVGRPRLQFFPLLLLEAANFDGEGGDRVLPCSFLEAWMGFAFMCAVGSLPPSPEVVKANKSTGAGAKGKEGRGEAT